MTDARRHAPAAARNRDPILEVLRRVLPERGEVLEIAAGTGEHACYFARALPGLSWQPTDPDPGARASIDAWREHEGLPNLRPALALDVTEQPWPAERADAIVNINMIHISPWEATEALLRGASATLSEGGVLVTYGPYRIGGAHTADSNARFDASLRAREPSWGVRDLDDLIQTAAEHGLRYEERVAMPANNFCVVYRRAAG